MPESHRSTNQNLRYSSNSLLYGEMITSQSSNNQNKGKLQDMLNALGERETGKKSGDTSQYKFENQELGFIGKYQFAEILLIRLGYYKAKIYYGNGADKNYWRGTWTNKRGIDSKTKLLNSPEVQEAAIREAFEVYLQDINYLLKQRRKSINEYLGKQGKFNDNGKSKNIKVTLSGLMAAAHLRGADKVVDLLVLGKVSRDEFGTSILEYLDKFGGYETTPKDFQVRG
ncbi:MAG: hypothetical protein HC903_21590 [Methylacidiphilales bacterium]|nr:hypothetical protein [Candidatus Methylacidiphilales bacterium]